MSILCFHFKSFLFKKWMDLVLIHKVDLINHFNKILDFNSRLLGNNNNFNLEFNKIKEVKVKWIHFNLVNHKLIKTNHKLN